MKEVKRIEQRGRVERMKEENKCNEMWKGVRREGKREGKEEKDEIQMECT